MSHGTISSTQIDLNSPDYASAKNNPYIAGLLSAGWRWGTAGHTDGTEEQTIHYFLEGSNLDPAVAPNQDIYVHMAMLTWSSVANIHFSQVFNIDEAEIVVHNVATATIGHYAGYSGTPNQALNENTNTTVTDLNNNKIMKTFQLADLGQVDTYFPSNHP